MKTTAFATAVLAALTLSVSGANSISDRGSGILMDNGKLSSWMVKKQNYRFNLSGKDKDNKSFGMVILSQIWYHGRTGNTTEIYKDQDEAHWATQKTEVKGGTLNIYTGNVDLNVVRTVEHYDDIDAVKLQYLITPVAPREFARTNIPSIYLTKEIESVTFDDGTMKNFKTAKVPEAKEIARSSALLMHMPKRGKTLLVLADLNYPLQFGYKMGLMPALSKPTWFRGLSFNQLWQGPLPYLSKDSKMGACVYFQLLDGGEFSDAQKAAVAKLAERFKVTPPKFSGDTLKAEFKTPSALAGKIKGADKIWYESTLKRVYPEMDAPSKVIDAVPVEAAANERESFQLVFAPGAGILNKVSFSDLTDGKGHKIPAANFAANLLEYQIVQNFQAYLTGEHRFADKMLPAADVLPRTLSSRANSIMHVTLYVPPKTPKGLYKGAVTLDLSGKKVTVPVAVKVWGFELPRESAFKTHGLLWSCPQEHRDAVLKYLAECGIGGTVYYGGQRELRKYFDGKEINMPDKFALAEKAIKEYNMQYFQAPYAFMGAWDWKPGKKVYFLNLDIESEEFNTKFTNYLKSFHRQATERGILDKSFIYIWDEMTGGHYSAMERTNAMVRKYAPGLKILTVSAPDPKVIADNDIIVVGPPSQWWSDDMAKVVADSLKQGKQLWIYMNAITFGTDVPALMPRMTHWYCHSYGFNGFLQWTMDYNWTKGTFATNGKEWMLYPAKASEKPIYSVRVEYFRDGVEDFNMMALMKKLPAATQAKLNKEISSIAPAAGQMVFDPVKLTDIRRKIAEALEKGL